MNDYILNQFKQILREKYNKCQLSGDVPVACIIFNSKTNKIVSTSYNMREKEQSIFYHAEIIAIKKAEKKMQTWHLNECSIISTLEPCPLCLEAIKHTRIKNIYYFKEQSNSVLNKKEIVKIKKNKLNWVEYDNDFIEFFKKLRKS